MNYCRTCKHWSLNANYLGLGNCSNFDMLMRVQTNGVLFTAQNFGCVGYEEGRCEATLFSESDLTQQLNDFTSALPRRTEGDQQP